MSSADSNPTRAATAVRALVGFFNLREPRVVDELVAAPTNQHNPQMPNGSPPSDSSPRQARSTSR